jgi:outer membrane protein assembly factor BamB
LPLGVLDKLSAIKDREFPTAEAFERWLDDNEIADPTRKAVVRAVPTSVDKANDTVLCLDTSDGKTLWKAEFPGHPDGRKGCCTPCIQKNRCFVAGAGGAVYCLDVADGKEIWKTPIGNAGGINSSPVVVDDLVVVLAGSLTALDVESGKVKWQQEKVKGSNNSPSGWTCDGVPYVICNSRREVACVNARDGKVMWTVPGGGSSSAAASGDYMVVLTGKGDGLAGYRISPSEAKELWKAPVKDHYASPILCGEYAYAAVADSAICVEMKTGKVLWTEKIGSGGCASPLIAGDRIIATGKNSVVMVKVSPEKCEPLASMKCAVVQGTSPGLADGKLFVRLNKAVACYALAQ